MGQSFRRLVRWYSITCTALCTLMFVFIAYASFTSRTARAQLPNGAYVNRAHPFSDQVVLRAPDGAIIIRDVAHVLFNEEYVAGELYDAPYSTERFIYRIGDEHAVLDRAVESATFDRMLAESGLDEGDWPWGSEDPMWLDFRRLMEDPDYKRVWHE